MTKYYLAIDKNQGKFTNKSDRFKIINLSEILGRETTTIWDITKFTGKFNNTEELMQELYNHNYVTDEDLRYTFSICYVNPRTKVWTACAKSCDYSSRVLFKKEAKNLEPGAFASELLGLGLPNNRLFYYKTATEEQKQNLELILKIGREAMFNEYYEYDYIAKIGMYLVDYAKSAMNYGFINDNYYRYIDDLVSNLAYSYHKYDYDHAHPKTKENGEIMFKERHFFEFVMFYHNEKRKLNKQKENDMVIYDEVNTHENAVVRKRQINYGTQITFNDILKS